jgi:DNA-binding NarL/FixJ family response regulator
VIDDHPLTALGVAQFLQQMGIEDVPTVSEAGQALHHIAGRGAPCLAVVDFWLGDGASTTIVNDILALAPSCRVLMTSGDTHPAIARKAQAAGAHGFVPKAHSPQLLHQAVTALLSGNEWFDAPLPARPAAASASAIRMTANELGLTPRQAQVLSLVLQGRPNQSIAQHLHLSPHTVKEHVAAVLQRLGVHNRIEAITQLQGVALELAPADALG